MSNIIVTGGAGFIGSNLIKHLNAHDIKNIIVVDNLANGEKIRNLASIKFIDFVDKNDFDPNAHEDIDCIFHLGACSATTEWDGKYLMKNNYDYSKSLLHYASKKNVKFIYASSASVYGLGQNGYHEVEKCELPINAYAFSKFQFDRYVRSKISKLKNTTIGLRYFNVYGPGESLKGDMSSIIYKFYSQGILNGKLSIFGAGEGSAAGMHQRDFVHVDDCVKINHWMYQNQTASGIFNVGSGQAVPFNAIASIVKEWFKSQIKENIEIEYINFPEHLKGSYQSYTCADLTSLRSQGYCDKFSHIRDGVNSYLDYLNSTK